MTFLRRPAMETWLSVLLRSLSFLYSSQFQYQKRHMAIPVWATSIPLGAPADSICILLTPCPETTPPNSCKQAVTLLLAPGPHFS